MHFHYEFKLEITFFILKNGATNRGSKYGAQCLLNESNEIKKVGINTIALAHVIPNPVYKFLIFQFSPICLFVYKN